MRIRYSIKTYFCKICGIEYHSDNKSTKYCSRKCYDISQRKEVDIDLFLQMQMEGKTRDEIAKSMNMSRHCLDQKLIKLGYRMCRTKDDNLTANAKWKPGEPKKLPIGSDLFATVDEEDFDLLSKFVWVQNKRKNRNTSYAVMHIRKGKKYKRIQLHRYIMKAKLGQIIDHINGNGLDCRRSNLRFCTSAQNKSNTHRKPGKSGFIGVRQAGNKWVAGICHNYKKIHLGTWSNPVDAAKAYDRKSLELKGEFAYLNFPSSKHNK